MKNEEINLHYKVHEIHNVFIKPLLPLILPLLKWQRIDEYKSTHDNATLIV